MTETQRTISDWARATFPGGDDLSPRHCLRLLEEVVELCFAAGATPREVNACVRWPNGQGWAESMPDTEHVPAELADCEIVIRVLAERRGVDLQAEVDRKMVVNRSRRWAANGDGTGYHIKD